VGVCPIAFAAVLSLWPIWNVKTLGDWRADPYTEYSRRYMPFDVLGFGLNTTPPTVTPPAEVKKVGDQFVEMHRQYTLESLPKAFVQRIIVALALIETDWRHVLAAFFVIGVVVIRPATAVAVTSLLALFVCYLAAAHPLFWTLYYIDALPAYFLVVALGIANVINGGVRAAETEVTALKRLPGAVVVCCFAFLPFLINDIVSARKATREHAEFQVRAGEVLDQLTGQRAIVFVDYPPDHNFNNMLTSDGPDLWNEPLWVVTDRGKLNDQLIASDPTRRVYTYHVKTGTLDRSGS
jgi:hypothetical protein